MGKKRRESREREEAARRVVWRIRLDYFRAEGSFRARAKRVPQLPSLRARTARKNRFLGTDRARRSVTRPVTERGPLPATRTTEEATSLQSKHDSMHVERFTAGRLSFPLRAARYDAAARIPLPRAERILFRGLKIRPANIRPFDRRVARRNR